MALAILTPISVCAHAVRAQGLLIAPNAVVVDARTHTGSVTLVNNGTDAAEVSLSTRYGFPATDTTGAMYLRTFDAVDDTTPSAATWVRSFPARLILQPGERRTVRILVTPPASLPAGEYWSRLDVTSRRAATTRTASTMSNVSATAEGAEASKDVQIGLNLEVHSLLALFYRNGAVSTGIELGTPRVRLAPDSLHVRVAMRRKGNAAFVGSIKATVRNASGDAVAMQTLPLGVYYELDPSIAMPRPRLAPGKYTVTVEALAARADVAPASLLQIPPTKVATELVVPDTR